MPFLTRTFRHNETITITVNTLEETSALGYELGTLVGPGTVILLSGELGSGKTTFVQGLAKGLGVPESYYVTSPSYTIINEYPGRVPLCHMDLYRISEPDELRDIGVDDIFNGNGVIAVEWPERLPHGTYHAHIRVEIAVLKGDSRLFSLTFSDMDLGY